MRLQRPNYKGLFGQHNMRLDFEALKNRYKGTRVMSLDMTKVDRFLENIHYAGEDKIYMWWDEFEKQMTWAFDVFDNDE